MTNQKLKTVLVKSKTGQLKFSKMERDLQDGRGVRCGHHLPPHKYIRNTSTCGTTPTEHLLNAGRRPQTSKSQETPHVPG